MYVALVVIFTLILIAVLIFFSRLKKRKPHKQPDTFLIGRPKGPNKKQESETKEPDTKDGVNDPDTNIPTKDSETQTQVSTPTSQTRSQTYVSTPTPTSHTGARGEKGVPGLPFQLNDCGNLVDGLMHDLVGNITTPFYYYAVSKDLRTYKTEIPQDLSSHLVCYVSRTQQWFDLGAFTSFTLPPTFLNVRSFESDGSTFVVPDHSYYVKYKLWKQLSYVEGVTEVHPGQIMRMTISSNNVDMTPRNQQNCVSYATNNATSRVVLWY